MILEGNSQTELQKLKNESVDLIVTDPPYGYSFMGKDWDKAVPSVELWAECLRVLKPGGFAFVMSAPRSDVQAQMIVRLTEAGFRMDFTPIYWTYASGFPKAGNIGKLVDKRNGVEREVIGSNTFGATSYNQYQEDGRAEKRTGTRDITRGESELEGSYAGFQPKPAVEVILVAMKPLSEKTFVDQALANGKGITWLDDVRVPTEQGADLNGGGYRGVRDDFNGTSFNIPGTGKEFVQPSGRFPANLLASDDVLNDGIERASGAGIKRKAGWQRNYGVYGKFNATEMRGAGGDSGSYSRYFDLDAWFDKTLSDLPASVQKTFPFLIVPKASKGEKNEGLQHLPDTFKPSHMRTANGTGERSVATGFPDTVMKNHHPTVKPLKLMSYLITLGSRPGDVVLDPFVGSGTTCVAAKMLNREHIGIELAPEYVEIAKARLEAAKAPEPSLFEEIP